MSKQESLARHRVIIQKLRMRPSSFSEIIDKLNNESELNDMNFDISLRTFQRDVKEIETLYGIQIKYNRSKKAYNIVEDNDDPYNERMFEALDIFQVLKINHSISDFIQFDTRKPLGTELLSGLIHAIQNKIQIQINHQGFWSETSKWRTIEPYLLKESRFRWYILAFDIQKKEFRTYALDRIFSIRFSDLKFQYPQHINAKEYYNSYYGILSNESGEIEKIKLKFYNNQGKYILSLPLHSSQKIVEENGEEMTMEFKLIPSYDFKMELLSMGENVKVIEPQHLAKEIKSLHLKAFELYN